MKLLQITTSEKPEKKMKAVFENDNGRTKTIHFGQAGADDYTLTHDKAQRARYLFRHSRNEDHNRPDTAGSLSARVLWGAYTNKAQNIQAYKRRFGL